MLMFYYHSYFYDVRRANVSYFRIYCTPHPGEGISYFTAVVLIKYNSYNTRSFYAAARTYNYVVRLCDMLRRCIHEHAYLRL